MGHLVKEKHEAFISAIAEKIGSSFEEVRNIEYDEEFINGISCMNIYVSLSQHDKEDYIRLVADWGSVDFDSAELPCDIMVC